MIQPPGRASGRGCFNVLRCEHHDAPAHFLAAAHDADNSEACLMAVVHGCRAAIGRAMNRFYSPSDGLGPCSKELEKSAVLSGVPGALPNPPFRRPRRGRPSPPYRARSNAVHR